MRSSVVRTIFLKELRDIFRDRRTLIVTIVLPILLYPMLMIGFSMMTAAQLGKMEKRKVKVAVINAQAAPALMSVMDTIRVLAWSDTTAWQAAISTGDLDAAVQIGPDFESSVESGRPAELTIYHNSSRDLSEQAAKRLQDAVETYQNRVVQGRLIELSADTSLLRPFTLHDSNLASAEQRQGSILGRILGYILIIMTLMGAFYPAIDLTAGEKERGTLETLLVSPAGRAEIVYGKFFAVLSVSMITALLNIASLGFTMIYMVRILGRGSESFQSLAIEPLSLVMALLLILPLAITFAALCLAIAVGARTYKEGQGLLSPLYSLVILPSMVSLLPGTEMTPKLAAIPLVNISLLIKEYMAGNYYWLETLIAFGSISLMALLALTWAISQFRQEAVIFRHSEAVRWSPFRLQRRSAPRTELLPSPGAALLLIIVGLILLFVVSGMVADQGVVRTILIGQITVFLPAAFLLYRGGYNWKRVVQFHAPLASAWPATFFTMAGGWVLALGLATLQNQWFPFPESLLQKFLELFESLNALPLPLAFFIIALLPAINEELFCRGIVLRSWLPRFGPAMAIFMSALAFGLLHLDPYRFIGTTFLGLLLGYIAYSTGSILPSMFAHALNNGLSFAVQKYAGLTDSSGTWLSFDSIEQVPWYWLLSGLISMWIGLFWLQRVRNQTFAHTASSDSHVSA